VLKTRDDFRKYAIPVMAGLLDGRIVEFDLSEKVIDFKLWFMPIMEKQKAGAVSIDLKFKKGDVFNLNKYKGFLSGDKEQYLLYQKEIASFLEKEIPECPVSFKREEFKGSFVDAKTKSLMMDAGILK
jgi:hypothetical protein